MLSKLTLALVTTAVIGAATLTPSTADAHWRGYGWYGGGYGYSHSYWKPHYGYGYGHYGHKPRLLPPALRLESRPRLLLIARRADQPATTNATPAPWRAGVGA